MPGIGIINIGAEDTGLYFFLNFFCQVFFPVPGMNIAGLKNKRAVKIISREIKKLLLLLFFF